MVKQTSFYAYHFRLGHPAAPIAIEYFDEDEIDTSVIDAWLRDYVGLDPENRPPAPRFADDTSRTRVGEVVSRAILLYGEFVSACGIACERPGLVTNVVALDGENPGYRVSILLTALDNVSLRHFSDLFSAALGMVRRNFRQAPERDLAEKVLGQVKQTVLEPFASRTPFNIKDESILEIAARQGVPYRHIGMGITRLGTGSRSRLLQYSKSDADSSLSKEICGYKLMTSHVLHATGFPGAEHSVAGSVEEAERIAGAMGWPVVVKPPNRERSEGVTTNIRDREALAAAVKRAQEYEPRVLVERHVPGDCHRIFVAGGRLIYVVRRIPKSVTGDGKSTITELAGQENERQLSRPPWRRLRPWSLDGDVDAVLASQGLARDDVPEVGRRVDLRDVPSNEWGGWVENLTDSIHPENAQMALDIARMIGMSVAGVDLITTDISRPWHENGAVVNEVNHGPEFKRFEREDEAATVIPALIEGDGRIPVSLLAGDGDLFERALSLAGNFGGAHVTTATRTQRPSGETMPLRYGRLFDRALALAMRPDVDAIVMAGSERDFLVPGLAVDRIDRAWLAFGDEERSARFEQALRMHVEVGRVERLRP